MSDIVERLRSEAETADYDSQEILLAEAAATIQDLTLLVIKLLKHAPEEKVEQVTEYLRRKNLFSPLRCAALEQEPPRHD